jgi:hypothetical protein
LCIFSDFEHGGAKVTPVADVDANEPMTVVDDVDAKRSFLLLKDVLYDAEGREAERLPRGLDQVPRIREVWKVLRKHTPKDQPE